MTVAGNGAALARCCRTITSKRIMTAMFIPASRAISEISPACSADLSGADRRTSVAQRTLHKPIFNVRSLSNADLSGADRRTPVAQRTLHKPIFNVRSLSQSAGEGGKAEDHPWLQLVDAPETFIPEERVLTFLSANIAAGRLADVAQDWRHLPTSWHESGMEVVLQTHLFAGFAKAINGLATVQAVGVHCRTPAWREEHRDADKWKAAGESSCEAIYGRVYLKLRDRMRKMHPLLDGMMIEHGYGRVLSRPGLSLRMRELCVVAVLTGLDVAPQLNSHLRGAVRVGATETEVRAVVAQTALSWGREAQAQADATLESVVAARYGL